MSAAHERATQIVDFLILNYLYYYLLYLCLNRLYLLFILLSIYRRLYLYFNLTFSCLLLLFQVQCPFT